MLKAINTSQSPRGTGRTIPGFRKIERLLESDRIETPVLVLSRSAVRRNLRRISRALPGVAVHYAVKANNHPAILAEVAAAGYGFDIASFQELQQLLEAGGRIEKTIHSHPIKSPREIAEAIAAGMTRFVVDNPDEIDKFRPYADRVKLLVRFRVDESSAVVNLSYKFGCEPSLVGSLVAKMHHLGIPYGGLTFHVGSQCLDSGVYIEAIRTAGDIIDRLAADGFKTDLLDIGGGFPVPYTSEVPPLSEFCRGIRIALRKSIPQGIALACEPGRFISGTAVTLVASVIGKSVRSGKKWYFLDDGLYGSFSGRLYDHCRYRVLTNRNTVWKRSVLAGPTCDSFDIIYRDVLLPPLEVGDRLMFPSMGAYCSVSASTFNSLRKAEYIVTS